MIKKVYQHRDFRGPAPSMPKLYWAVVFEDDQKFYQMVNWSKDKFGSPQSQWQRSYWFYLPEELSIHFFESRHAKQLLTEHGGWSSIRATCRKDWQRIEEIADWCQDMGYLYYRCNLIYGSIRICIPSKKDALFLYMKFGDCEFDTL